MADREGIEGRIDDYLGAIVAMARHGALTGTPGSWVSIGVRAEDASRRWRRTQACHPRLHARYQELELWGWVLGAYVLPDRQQTLATAIHRIGAAEASDDLAGIEAILEVVCPEPHQATHTSARPRSSLQEFAVLRQLQTAERQGTAAVLDSALRATIVLAEAVGEDAQAGHRRCAPWPVLTVSYVLTKAMWETMPRPHRAALAHVAQRLFFAAYAPEAPTPEFLDQAPEFPLPTEDDPMWRFDPAWHYVACAQREEDWLDPGPEPWLIEVLEAPVRRAVEGAVRHEQELERKFALLAAGQPPG